MRKTKGSGVRDGNVIQLQKICRPNEMEVEQACLQIQRACDSLQSYKALPGVDELICQMQSARSLLKLLPVVLLERL